MLEGLDSARRFTGIQEETIDAMTERIKDCSLETAKFLLLLYGIITTASERDSDEKLFFLQGEDYWPVH